MSDLARLATALERASDAELESLISCHFDNQRQPSDLFELGRQLLTKRALESRVRELGKADLDLLQAHGTNPTLEMAWLADKSGSLEAAQRVARELVEKTLREPTKLAAKTTDLRPSESLRCFAELLYAADRRWLPSLRSGLRTAEVAEFAKLLHLQDSQVKACATVLVRLGLLVVADGSWRASAMGNAWLSRDLAGRWRELVSAVVAQSQLYKMLPTEANFELHNSVAIAQPLREPSSDILWVAGPLLGLIHEGKTTNLLCLLKSGDKTREELLEESLNKLLAPPEHRHRLMVQSDLSVVVAGRIDPKLRAGLERLCDAVEVAEYSSLFKITLISLSRALDAGMTSNQIEEFLSSESATPLPQPFSFLLSDAQRRFSELSVHPDGDGSQIVSKDPIRLAEIRYESALRQLALREGGANTLLTKKSARECAMALRAAGYPAQCADAASSANLSDPRKHRQAIADDWIKLSVRRMRDSLASETGGMEAMFNFAQKAGAPVIVQFKSPKGISTVSVRILGVTDQRIRCRELGSEAELTLPRASIQDLKLT